MELPYTLLAQCVVYPSRYLSNPIIPCVSSALQLSLSRKLFTFSVCDLLSLKSLLPISPRAELISSPLFYADSTALGSRANQT